MINLFFWGEGKFWVVRLGKRSIIIIVLALLRRAQKAQHSMRCSACSTNFCPEEISDILLLTD
jgi:hypothetical protein